MLSSGPEVTQQRTYPLNNSVKLRNFRSATSSLSLNEMTVYSQKILFLGAGSRDDFLTPHP